MYYKANPKVAEDLQVTALRRKLDDGNYILWFADMIELAKRLGVWGEDTVATMVGAVPLTPIQAKEEQDGKILRELPVPTVEKYVMPATTEGEDAVQEELPDEEPVATDSVADASVDETASSDTPPADASASDTTNA